MPLEVGGAFRFRLEAEGRLQIVDFSGEKGVKR